MIDRLNRRVWWRVAIIYVCLLGALGTTVGTRCISATPAKIMPIAEHATPTPQKTQPNTPPSNPVRITIPSVGIDLAVVNGDYNAQTTNWSVSADKANYAVNTSPPNTVSGETLIYGHDSNAVFHRTKGLKYNDKVFVEAANGQTFVYALTTITIVKPNDTSLFNNLGGKPHLLLLTCDGLWYQNRMLMTFEQEKT